jgi:external thioesterase TEII
MKKPQLFILHFAGGNCYSFNFLTPLLKDFETLQVELPGRGKRIREELVTEFDLAAEDLFRQITGRLGSAPFVIYGHSMGAYLALRVTNLLKKAGKQPLRVYVSGNPGPGIRDLRNRYKMPYKELVEELRRLGGVPQELLDNEELLEFFMPILRADFEVAERNDLTDEEPLGVPLHALMGSDEEDVDKIGNWGRFTTSQFQSTVLPGGHFFIYDHPEQLARILREDKR